MTGYYYSEMEVRSLLDAKQIAYKPDNIVDAVRANVLPGVLYEPTSKDPQKPFKITDKTLYETLDQLLEETNEHSL